MSTQTLKSAIDSRVDVGQTWRLGSQRQNLGEGLMCPAGAGDIAFDIYGRPADQNTLTLTDSSIFCIYRIISNILICILSSKWIHCF